MIRIGLAAALLAPLAACGGSVDTYDTFMDKCIPVAQMLEQQGGAAQSLLDAYGASAACECAWDKYQTELTPAEQRQSGAIRASVSACLAELSMEQ